MLLTLYYMAATVFQSFRHRSFVSRIAKQLSDRVSVVFYNYPEAVTTGKILNQKSPDKPQLIIIALQMPLEFLYPLSYASTIERLE